MGPNLPHAISATLFLPFNTALLLHDSLSDSVRIQCDYPASLYAWSKSDDGSEANAVMLDTSEEKYTIISDNSLDIGLSRVTGADGGLYRCVYGGIGTTSELCVYVYGKFRLFQIIRYCSMNSQCQYYY